MKDIQGLPFQVNWREYWDARDINGTTLPSKISGGHPLALSGASLKTTAEGVHFVNGVATSNVKFTDPYDGATEFWCSLRFKLDEDFSSASTADQYLLGKFDAATDLFEIYLYNGDGKLYWETHEGGSSEFIGSVETSWNAGQWYHVLVSYSSTSGSGNGMRLIIDGGTPVTDGTKVQDLTLIADICIGALDDGVSTDGFAGIISDVVMSSDVLSTNEESDLYQGVVPADAVNKFCFDEGRGTTANDRGSGADNGTLDSSCTWAFGEVMRPCLSCDGINDVANTAATTVDITMPCTLIVVQKLRGSLLGVNKEHQYMVRFEGGDGDSIRWYYNTSTDNLKVLCTASGTDDEVASDLTYSFGDYHITIATIDVADLRLYCNGQYKGQNATIAAIEPALATAYIGRSSAANGYDGSQYLLVGLLEGVLTSEEARAFTKWLNNQLGLGLTI